MSSDSPVQSPAESYAARFWAKVQKTDGCWLWTASVHRRGYGQFSVKADGRWTMHIAPQVALELAGVPRPEGAFALHRCNNPRCVRPDHLYWGDHKQNMRDVAAAGTQVGERNPRCKLTAEQVAEIRKLRASRVALRVIAERFGIDPATAGRIANGVYRRLGEAGDSFETRPKRFRVNPWDGPTR